LLPIIIFSNIVRIILTLLGIVYIGDVILSDSVHSGMGFGMVLLTVILFICVGKLFHEKEEKPEGQKPEKEN
jgi:exosortase/archaeosortase family protein